MATKKDETASFVLRLSQKIFSADDGTPALQWRGSIRHVQSGEEARFSNFEDAQAFVQAKLTDMTVKAVEDKPEEEQKGIIAQSFDFWRKVASATPKLVIDSIKDPKKQAAHLQEQIQEQIHHFSDAIGHTIEEKIGTRLEPENWMASSKADYKELLKSIEQLSAQLSQLNDKVDALAEKNDKA